MAETKRQSIGGKVATPKTATSSTPALSMPSSPDALLKLIGARVKISTAAPHSENYEGILFTACPILNIVALNTDNAPAKPQSGDYHVIPISRIQACRILATGSSDKSSNGSTSNVKNAFANAQPVIGPVDVRQLAAREEARVSKLKEEESHRGKGVTAEAQAIYDSFKRLNNPIRWHNQEMIVLDAVIISPPYRVEDCKGAKDKQEALNRVRKILEGERRKLQLNQQSQQPPTAPTVAIPTGTMRKGG